MIWKINRNDGLDIIHVQYKKEQIIATIVAKLFGIKVVWTEHGPLHSLIVKNPILLWVYRFCALLADKIIVVSTHSGFTQPQNLAKDSNCDSSSYTG
jgi:hypothetical protein